MYMYDTLYILELLKMYTVYMYTIHDPTLYVHISIYNTCTCRCTNRCTYTYMYMCMHNII